ncbi:DotH/IcmK family type IV secretion protein [Vibrio coralliilyticus]|uniref:DotH/IcmK family type IV secretion protein n=1 Tax=Vibrio coralliilyticus TaxID=190893 RepID=UPI001E3C5265|nr:DotH/IcmK family type IV secretion protein [Vibrio coralliilyticus]MCC2524965.1 DotH/IcmK family type IV secretion protein [Vibrio coralliilyticus]
MYSSTRLYRALMILMSVSSVMPSVAGIQIVQEHPVLSIETLDSYDQTQLVNAHSPNEFRIENENVDYDSNSGTYYDKDAIKKRLFKQFKTVDNMILYADSMSLAEQNVVRELALAKLTEQEQRISDLKSNTDIARALHSLEAKDEEYRLINSPERIKQRREDISKTEAAKNRPLYNNNINVRSIPYDPNSIKQIRINNRVNRPTVISFFDRLGAPYSIESHIPNQSDIKAKSFDVLKPNSNQLLIVSKANDKEVSGFVFLKGATQPVPFYITSFANQDIDVTVNIMLSTISPDNDMPIESVKVPFTKLNKDDDPYMSAVLSGRIPPNAKPLKVIGLPPGSQAYRIGEYFYFRTEAILKYEVYSANSIGNLYAFKAVPRATYFFYVNNVETEVSVYES